jgi:hypothetical protein
VTADLAVLTPPLVVCVAILVAVVAVLRHEMGPRRARRGGAGQGDGTGTGTGTGTGDDAAEEQNPAAAGENHSLPAENHSAARIGDQGKSGTVADSAGETPNEGHAETTGRGSDPRQ